VSVYLVGAGPGDPSLITVRGLELVRSCDVLVHDRLVSPELVAEAPAGALLVERDRLSQEEVNALLVAYGRAGFETVRLKGGDPFVFGRGGEEAVALAAAGVPFEVVPGVSSLAAVPAAAGIPVTHRGVSAQVTLVAAHAPERLDYRGLARAEGTLVLFMGLARLGELADGLIAAGKNPSTPAAAIASGTLPEQEVVTGTLAQIAGLADGLEPPALVVVGEVVELRELILPSVLPGTGRERLAGEEALDAAHAPVPAAVVG
jgi:uroporphyrin-III C-methyltransferase